MKVSTEQSCYQRQYLEDPVEGSLLVENLEAAVTGEGEETVGENVPVTPSHPRDLNRQTFRLVQGWLIGKLLAPLPAARKCRSLVRCLRTDTLGRLFGEVIPL